jgi:hypothetical protein
MSSMVERMGRIAAVQELRGAGRLLGKILLDAGKLKAGDAERVLQFARQSGIRFGQACVQLKLAAQSDVAAALSQQFDYPCLISPQGELGDELAAAYRCCCTGSSRNASAWRSSVPRAATGGPTLQPTLPSCLRRSERAPY